jgi:hypothetical protein
MRVILSDFMSLDGVVRGRMATTEGRFSRGAWRPGLLE